MQSSFNDVSEFAAFFQGSDDSVIYPENTPFYTDSEKEALLYQRVVYDQETRNTNTLSQLIDVVVSQEFSASRLITSTSRYNSSDQQPDCEPYTFTDQGNEATTKSYINSMAVPVTLCQSLPDKTTLPTQGQATHHPSSLAKTMPRANLNWMTFWTSTNPTHSRSLTPHKARMSPRTRIMTLIAQTSYNQSRCPRTHKGTVSPRIAKTKLIDQTSSNVSSPKPNLTMMIYRTTGVMNLKNTSTNRYSLNLSSIQYLLMTPIQNWRMSYHPLLRVT